MAVVSTLSNHVKFMIKTKKIDTENDVFKIILMDDAFAFDKDAHATLADVTASQLATVGGYTQDDKTLAGVAETEEDANDRSRTTWTDVSWTASGAGFGPTGAAIIYDDTTTDDTVIGCIDFGTDFTLTAGIDFQVNDIIFDLS